MSLKNHSNASRGKTIKPVSKPDDHYDVAIIGGGPGGSLLATLVRRQNPDKKVLILEQAGFPRHQVGESSLHSWRPILDRAGVLEKIENSSFYRKLGILFWWGRQGELSWTVDFREISDQGGKLASFQVERAAFDNLLLHHASEHHAHIFQEAKLEEVTKRKGGGFSLSWKVNGSTHRTTCDFLADASGQQRYLARLWNLPVKRFDDMNNYAVYGYWKGSKVAKFGPDCDDRDRWSYIGTSRDGWLWHIPITPDLTSVGLVTTANSIPAGGKTALERFYRENVESCPPIRDLLEEGELAKKPLAPDTLMVVKDWSSGVEKLCGPDWFLLGDAAVFIDPILSTGLHFTAHASSMVANALNTIWRDPHVNRQQLQESYTSTYLVMARSYHRLAQIWYSSNFKVDSWHWESKRQKVSSLLSPVDMPTKQAFLALAVGTFTNPVEGARLQGGTIHTDLFRPDFQIFQENLIGVIDQDALPLTSTVEGGSENAARKRIQEETYHRWRWLLGHKVAISGCQWKARDGYFTDATMDHWEKVPFVEIRPEKDAEHHFLAFPSHNVLPAGVMPFLDGSDTLRNTLIKVSSRYPAGSEESLFFKQLLFQQVLHLDFQGWLEIAPKTGYKNDQAHEFPPRLGLFFANERGWTPCRYAVDALGEVLTISLQGPEEARIRLTPRKESGKAYKSSRTTSLSYEGFQLSPALSALLDHLAGALERWEKEEPGALEGWWESGAAGLACAEGEITKG